MTSMDLPVGVIHGSDGRFYAPGDVVRTLDVALWEAFDAEGDLLRNDWMDPDSFAEVRPTAANPVPLLPESTFPSSDGRLWLLPEADLPDGMEWHQGPDDPEWIASPVPHIPGRCFEVRFPPPAPATEDVHWWVALRDKRTLPCGITCQDSWMYHGERLIGVHPDTATVDASGRVTVLVDGDQRKDVTR